MFACAAEQYFSSVQARDISAIRMTCFAERHLPCIFHVDTDISSANFRLQEVLRRSVESPLPWIRQPAWLAGGVSIMIIIHCRLKI